MFLSFEDRFPLLNGFARVFAVQLKFPAFQSEIFCRRILRYLQLELLMGFKI